MWTILSCMKQINPNLSDDQKAALFEGKNEYAFTGHLLYNDADGVYTCANCNAELFSSKNKYDSGSGWPSFDDAIEGAVEFRADDSLPFEHRTEMICANCGGHLGHVFPDGPAETTGMRYCASSLSLDFKKEQTNT